jgi:hypothetical protein
LLAGIQSRFQSRFQFRTGRTVYSGVSFENVYSVLTAFVLGNLGVTRNNVSKGYGEKVGPRGLTVTSRDPITNDLQCRQLRANISVSAIHSDPLIL